MSAAIDNNKPRDEPVHDQDKRIELWCRFAREHLIRSLALLNRREPALLFTLDEIRTVQKYVEFALRCESELRNEEKQS